MSDPSFLEVASSIRDVIRQNLAPAQQYISHSNNSPSLEQLASQQPIQQPFINFARHASAWKLPEAVLSELMAVMPKESMKHQEVAEQGYLRLLHDIHSRCDTGTAASLIPHARMARDAIYNRSVGGLLGVVQQLASGVDPEGGSISGVDDEDDSGN